MNGLRVARTQRRPGALNRKEVHHSSARFAEQVRLACAAASELDVRTKRIRLRRSAAIRRLTQLAHRPMREHPVASDGSVFERLGLSHSVVIRRPPWHPPDPAEVVAVVRVPCVSEDAPLRGRSPADSQLAVDRLKWRARVPRMVESSLKFAMT